MKKLIVVGILLFMAAYPPNNSSAGLIKPSINIQKQKYINTKEEFYKELEVYKKDIDTLEILIKQK